MIIDQQDISSTTERTFDLCIVGAGAAGITIARSLNAQDLSVCLVESGDYKYSEVNELYNGEATGVDPSYLRRTRLRMFGGTTNHWGGFCRPLDEYDFEQKSWLPDSIGWPFPRSALESYYDRAAAVVEVDPFFASEPESRDLLDAHCELNALRFGFSPPTRFGSRYRKALLDSKNVTVLLNCNGSGLKLDENTSLVRSLEVVTNNRTTFQVKAKRFVLALGGIENPRFLLNCNQTIPNGIGNSRDLVGRFFTSHSPSIELGAITLSGQSTEQVLDRLFVPEVGYIGIKERLKRRLQLLNHGFSLIPIPNEALSETDRQFTHIDHAFREFYQVNDDSKTAIERIIGSVNEFRYGATGKCFMLLSVGEQSPNANSRVLLGEHSDFTGMRQVRLQFKSNDVDRESISRSFGVLASELGKWELGRLRVSFDSIADVPFKPDDHHMCTTRMHDDPTFGVVDRNCKVHGTDNLYVAGSSVFPSGGFANPTLTLVALALRLSDHLKEQRV